MHPKHCKNGISFSIWEKVTYREDVLNVFKTHEKQYIFSTGGDFDLTTERSYPGLAIYHQGMDLIAVVSTGDDVWQLRVTGQLMNETWSNIGVRWEPNNVNATTDIEEWGGLEMYVNAEKVGHAIQPIQRPKYVNQSDIGIWVDAGPLTPNPADPAWGGHDRPPVIMVGCHRNTDDSSFRHYATSATSYDELSIWTRKLEVNRTHEETLYFTGGYRPIFEGMSIDEWYKMMDSIDFNTPEQAEAAAYIIERYSNSNISDPHVAGGANGTNGTSGDGYNIVLSGFPRTPQQQHDYEHMMVEYSVRSKLFSTESAKKVERPTPATKTIGQ